jgi:hypothetical protein
VIFWTWVSLLLWFLLWFVLVGRASRMFVKLFPHPNNQQAPQQHSLVSRLVGRDIGQVASVDRANGYPAAFNP